MIDKQTMVLLTMIAEPETRDNDDLLVRRVWERYYPECIKDFRGETYYNVKKLPRESVILRLRRKIQAENVNVYPLHIETALKRRMSASQWRKWAVGAGVLPL